MHKRGNELIKTLLLLFMTFPFYQCGEHNTDYYGIPETYVYYTINLNLPQYSDLNLFGGWTYIDEGFKGLIIYHKVDDTYIALERCCTYEPLEECSQVCVDESGIFLRCGHYDGEDFISCCGSNFDMEGNVIKGPALYPLKQYRVSRSAEMLTISN